jgi:heat shock protein HslJ
MRYIITILSTALLFSITSCDNGEVSKSKKKNEIQKVISTKDSYFVNTTWLLESIDGDKIVYPADYKQNYMIFKGEADGFTFSGFAGCNNISGKYDVGDHGTIGIENIISTRMACSFSELENKFIVLLKNTSSYKIEGYFMEVYNGDKKLATFKDAKELRNH